MEKHHAIQFVYQSDTDQAYGRGYCRTIARRLSNWM
ncbi:hypothetical protein MED222_06290 [Vibrio sp. MED222]|nr:hypothetical protein MED222_06290 [Vibrio sp. MED222]